MKRFLEIILGLEAKAVLWLNKPKIIGITGSVGKSSTKEAVACVLKARYKARPSPGNLNSQLGLPLAVLGFEKPGGFRKNLSALFQWLGILILGAFRIFQTNYPRILILEMGTDRPGDIAYLLSLSGQLDAAVITDIGISHLEFFRSPEDLAKEKLSLLKGLKKNGIAILNYDNDKIYEGTKNRSEVLSYGFSDRCRIKATDVQMSAKEGEYGIAFKVHYAGTVVPVFLPQALGQPACYAALAAVGVGIAFGMNLVEISQALMNYRVPAGRLRLISGVKETSIIDDTYNAAPSSTIAALKTLASVASGKKLAALGHMAELGKQTEEGHKAVAQEIMNSKIDDVFLVGSLTRIIEAELAKNNFKGKVSWYEKSEDAISDIESALSPGDTILVKGSQSARMEKIVARIMRDPAKAPELLVRQSKQWLE
jgi:UDP-N-acetylmuramyl pentapeptide synthase